MEKKLVPIEEKDIKKKNNSKKIIIGVIIIFLVVLNVVQFSYSKINKPGNKTTDEKSYIDYTFKYGNEKYNTIYNILDKSNKLSIYKVNSNNSKTLVNKVPMKFSDVPMMASSYIAYTIYRGEAETNLNKKIDTTNSPIKLEVKEFNNEEETVGVSSSFYSKKVFQFTKLDNQQYKISIK